MYVKNNKNKYFCKCLHNFFIQVSFHVVRSWTSLLLLLFQTCFIKSVQSNLLKKTRVGKFRGIEKDRTRTANSARFLQQIEKQGRGSDRNVTTSGGILWTAGTWQRWQTHRHRIVTFRDDRQKRAWNKRDPNEIAFLQTSAQKEELSRSCREKPWYQR